MKNLHQGKKEKWDQITPSTSPRARGTTEKFGNERVHHEASFQSVIRVLPELGKEHKTKPSDQERCARRVPWDLAKNAYKLKNTGEASFYSPIEATAGGGAHFQISRETRIRG